jgi:hypothetical protein
MSSNSGTPAPPGDSGMIVMTIISAYTPKIAPTDSTSSGTPHARMAATSTAVQANWERMARDIAANPRRRMTRPSWSRKRWIEPATFGDPLRPRRCTTQSTAR